MRDTIFALSSGAPPAGVAVIRISGPSVRLGLETVAGGVPEPRIANLAKIRDQAGMLLDQGLVLYFPGPASFTGEDVAELQIHGGQASVAAVVGCLSRIPGFRLAEPGEYTRRAFENGRMDLTAVEGLSDLIRAETEAQRRQALDQADGRLRSLYEDWARRITHARAMIEAELDFSDEEDIPGSVSDAIWPSVADVALAVEKHLKGAKSAELVRNGFRIALIGAPNAGKSSLLNTLAKRDVAIVSDIAGTTRDIVEVRLDIGGHLVLLQDTAGIRESEDGIEKEGIRRTRAAAEAADLVIELQDVMDLENSQDSSFGEFDRKLRVLTKADLAGSPQVGNSSDHLAVSSFTGEGIDLLMRRIGEIVSGSHLQSGEILPTRTRHKQHLSSCISELNAAIEGRKLPIELRAEYLRNAAHCLGRITGNVDVEDLLGVIFTEFCVGK